ncbi:MAG: hypothetical protein V4469_04705 [Patescibacteria group bacterium]
MRSSKEKDKLLTALEEIPFVDRACRKIGLHRSTFYRWCESDSDFSAKVQKAITLGREALNEIAESMLVKKIKDGDTPAIKFYLQNNSKNYIAKRSIYVIPPKEDHNHEDGCEVCGMKPLSKETADELRKNIDIFFHRNNHLEWPDNFEDES